ncbi:hypothetical protein ACFQDG_18430, partial [Natronoarchaeum mannanilyticum]|uniref:hypothetical protein n=1 Tax=Natronoarchaeum mannanilyticum TaxID=926360 RepID=UPI00362441DA
MLVLGDFERKRLGSWAVLAAKRSVRMPFDSGVGRGSTAAARRDFDGGGDGLRSGVRTPRRRRSSPR